MRWHSLNEPIAITTNPYYLVKYIDQFGRGEVADCVLKDGKFINLDKFIFEVLKDVQAWCNYDEIERYLNSNDLWRHPVKDCEYGLNNLGVIVMAEVSDTFSMAAPAVIKEESGIRHFVELEDMSNVIDNEIDGWVDTGDVCTILDGVKL